VYNKRKDLLTGKSEVDETLVKAFDERKAIRVASDKYAGIEVEICDVNAIQNTTKGVSGFWLRAMLSNKMIASTIMEKDRAILAYLNDIRLDLHEHDNGFTLFFDFESNSYFTNPKLTKKYHMSGNNVIEKCEGCEIKWTAGSDPTKTKKKKKQKKGGKKTNVTVTVKCESFFNFFETVDASCDDDHADKDEDDEEGGHDGCGEKIDADYELGNCFKDDLLPLALEYYLGVIEQESDGDDDDEDNDV
jgi:nucleosome assembly protein 1-like 1